MPTEKRARSLSVVSEARRGKAPARARCVQVPFADITTYLPEPRFRPVTTDCGLARKVRQSDTLQMLRVEKHVPGDFCWIELATTRSEEHTSELQSRFD